jgi:hypothetical protein
MYFDRLPAHGDIEGMLACTTDPARHHRLLESTGGGAARANAPTRGTPTEPTTMTSTAPSPRSPWHRLGRPRPVDHGLTMARLHGDRARRLCGHG